MGPENVAYTGFRTLDSPAHSGVAIPTTLSRSPICILHICELAGRMKGCLLPYCACR